jgi:hypothetical protein
MKIRAVIVLLVFGAVAALASSETIIVSRPRTQQLVESTHAPGAIAPRLAFADQPIEIRVELFVPPPADTTVPESWWKSVSWTIERDGEQGAAVRAADVTLVRQFASRGGSVNKFVADFRLSPLPVGDYKLSTKFESAEIPSALSEPFRFLVRAGTEDRDRHRAYLRFTSDNVAATASPDRFSRFRELMFELAQLEPDNPGVWERLGDIAASAAPPAETAGYYAKALGIAETNLREKFGDLDHLPPDVMERFARLRKNLTAFSRAMTQFGQGVHATVLNEHGTKTILLFRNGKIERRVE